MAETITLDLDTVDFQRRIRTLTDREVPRVLAGAINKVLFEINIDEREETLRSFDLSGSRGRTLFSNKASFRAQFAKPETLVGTIQPAPLAAPFLEEHQAGTRISKSGEVDRLAKEGKLAIPLQVKRGKSGKLSAKNAPGTIIAEKRGFVRGNVLWVRGGTKRRPFLKAAFALVQTAKLDARFDFYRVARDTARREFPRKFYRVLEKIR